MSDADETRLRRTEEAPKTGIVHLGLGAFFRAHGAVYIKQAMARSGGNWGIVGVSLRSPGIRNLLAPQEGVYTAVELSAQGLKPQSIDVVSDVLVAPENPQAVLDAMVDDSVRIVSLTVTEKGYCRGGADGALDLDHPEIENDLASNLPKSAIGFIVRALDNRRRKGLRPFTVLSLDNLPANGALTRRIVCEMAARVDSDLADWIASECCFPCTMVDRIVPAMTPDTIARLHRETGIHDPAAVVHEPFRQWVIEDSFVDGQRPEFEAVGAQLVDDVEPFENMKLRMLNGTHSAMAYIGSIAGHDTVEVAINDPAISAFLDTMWQEEIIPSLVAPPETDLADYAAALRERYRNPEIRHLLEQIAMDGSQKLPQRILDPLFENLAAGRPAEKLMTVVAAWFRFLSQRADGEQINDPISSDLCAAMRGHADDRALVLGLLSVDQVFGPYPTDQISDALVRRFQAMSVQNIQQDLGKVLS
ncbi:mannitol dehydrogenase family protein [Shimia abyssi]|uniref:Fructuronate reductase n=1 Tax=Shimia abyssi TaxID=1662395 RepID=A0A2P8F7P9_9RHOB|nr:mannitol dehydrogenase family protein [Shimia abyssi]PSL17738.1 fructuronate reductase [Shimia abyssi]